jgi:hypothetical protein
MSDYDSPWKEALDVFFEAFLELFLPQAYADIDWSKGLFERGWGEKQIRQLFRLIDWIIDLPEPLENAFWDQVKQLKEEKYMPFVTTPERMGRKEGLREGLSQGVSEGIEVALRLKFGEPALSLLPEIRQIGDEEKLETILHAIETAASPDDLRQIWAG